MTYVVCETEIDKYNNRGWDYFAKKKYLKALKMFNKEIGCDPNNFSGYWNSALVYDAIGDKLKAREYIEKALSLAEKQNSTFPDCIDKCIFEEMNELQNKLKEGV